MKIQINDKEIYSGPWWMLILAFAGVSFLRGIGEGLYNHMAHGNKPTTKCTGYVVLDASRVIMCNGDTVEYDWKIKPLLK